MKSLTDVNADRRTDMQTDWRTNRETDRHPYRHTDWHPHIQTDGQTDNPKAIEVPELNLRWRQSLSVESINLTWECLECQRNENSCVLADNTMSRLKNIKLEICTCNFNWFLNIGDFMKRYPQLPAPSGIDICIVSIEWMYTSSTFYVKSTVPPPSLLLESWELENSTSTLFVE